MPALIRPSDDPDPNEALDDSSSDEGSDTLGRTQATASTMVETDPFGFDLADLPPEPEVPPPADADDIIEISALSDGAAIDASPVPTSITVH